jgi:hypothetical protein
MQCVQQQRQAAQRPWHQQKQYHACVCGAVSSVLSIGCQLFSRVFIRAFFAGHFSPGRFSPGQFVSLHRFIVIYAPQDPKKYEIDPQRYMYEKSLFFKENPISYLKTHFSYLSTIL